MEIMEACSSKALRLNAAHDPKAVSMFIVKCKTKPDLTLGQRSLSRGTSACEKRLMEKFAKVAAIQG
jgi:hypothetical protein